MSSRALGLALTSAACVLLQAAYTRLLSTIYWYQFAYLVVSLAVLGIGVAGSWLYGRKNAPTETSLARWSAGCALSILGSLIVVTRFQFDFLSLYQRGDLGALLVLGITEVAVLVPFLFAGLVIGKILMDSRESVARYYSLDLIGAASGCIGAMVLLDRVHPTVAALVASSLAGCAGFSLLNARSRVVQSFVSVAVLLGPLLILGDAQGTWFRTTFAPGKFLFGSEHLIETTAWNSLARIDVLEPLRGLFQGPGGVASPSPQDRYDYRFVTQDGGAPTAIIQPTGPPQSMEVLGKYLQAVPYSIFQRPQVLILGAGGGLDILIALHHEASRILAVELNSSIATLLRSEYYDFSNQLVDMPGVRYEAAEGRTFVSREKRSFDLIQLSGVDSFSALASGSYALSENYLYTKEAFQGYFERLKGAGVVAISRWLLDPPRESARLVSTALAALEERGAADVHECFFVVEGPKSDNSFSWALTMIAPEGFTSEQARRLRARCEATQFSVLYDPDHADANIFNGLIRATPADRERHLRDYRFNLAPTTDDNPFFFQFYRWRYLLREGLPGRESDSGVTSGAQTIRTGRFAEIPLSLLVLFASVVILVPIGLLLVLSPIYWRRRRGAEGNPGARASLYFVLLGIGFMAIELLLMQEYVRYLGNPAHALAITLGVLLSSAALGSRWMERFLGLLGHRRAALAVVLLAALSVRVVFSGVLHDATIAWPFSARIALASLTIVPLGFVLGVFLPAGLRWVGARSPAEVPWAYGLNAIAGVLGATAAVTASITFGRQAAWVMATVVYGLAIMLLDTHSLRRVLSSEGSGR